MNDNAEFQLDVEPVMKMFGEFDWKERRTFFRRLFTKSLGIMKKQAIHNLSNAVEQDKITFKDQYGNTLAKGIRITTYRKVKGARIDILGNFKLKFFELGTKDRYQEYNRRKPKKQPLKKDRYTGSIKPSHFFTSARSQTQGQILSDLEKNMIKIIQQINKKKYK